MSSLSGISGYKIEAPGGTGSTCKVLTTHSRALWDDIYLPTSSTLFREPRLSCSRTYNPVQLDLCHHSFATVSTFQVILHKVKDQLFYVSPHQTLALGEKDSLYLLAKGFLPARIFVGNLYGTNVHRVSGHCSRHGDSETSGRTKFPP